MVMTIEARVRVWRMSPSVGVAVEPYRDMAATWVHGSPVSNRVETKCEAPGEEMLSLFLIGMIETALDVTQETLESDAAI